MIRQLSLATACAGLALTALADAPAQPDPVAASFERMLNHPPLSTSPVVPQATPADPLRKAVLEALWDKQELSFHVAMQASGTAQR